jgi:NAD(P)-dependent dehydrogenase (short-subunit alcohol dehydrogenase family)
MNTGSYHGISDKVAIISGGASGIGKACAELFASSGAKVAILDIDGERGQEVSEGIKERGGQAVFVSCDVSDYQASKQAVKRAVDAYGEIHFLVNAAGIAIRASVVDTSESDWDRTIAVNLKSVYLLCKHAIPLIEKAGGGAIINLASGWGLVGGKNAAAYCASKGAVVLLTKAMALDHGPQNIRVNCICPGDTKTPMLKREAEELGISFDQLVEDSSRQRPLGRIGDPEEIAQAALFLASSGSSYITGSALVVDGGALAGSV